MIRPSQRTDRAATGPDVPAAAGPRPVFVVPWTSGPDPALDGLVRIQALRPGPASGSWERFDRLCAPRDPTAAIARAFGIAAEELEGATSAEEAWSDLLEFVGALPLVVPDAGAFEAWHVHLSGRAAPLFLGLEELVALFLPGRLAARREELVALFADGAPAREFGPEDLRLAAIGVAQRVHGLDGEVLRILAAGCTRAWRGLAAADPAAAARIGLALALFDATSTWAGDHLAGVEDGRLARWARAGHALEDLLEEARPACAREAERWNEHSPLRPDREEPTPFHASDLSVLDAVFERHLPATFAGAGGSRGSYRATQHAVAREMARTLGERELLLVHAPTGTGKTLAYLVPALLWARRHEVRLGIATFTRALQEQALDREVPRALQALASAGVPPGLRVSLLKGRDNYLCWRALKNALPEDDGGEPWLAWTQLALFALTDVEGDLDRLPRRPPLRLSASSPYLRALEALLRVVRGESGCCPHKEDRATCAAELARRRAERSHVVVVNQAFALARPEFFKRLVFDECEHLHDQAHNAWSRTLSFRELRAILARISQPGKAGARGVLDRVARQLLPGTPTGDAVLVCQEVVGRTELCVDELEEAARAFDVWRVAELRQRPESEQHFLMREYAEHHGQELIGARIEVSRATADLDQVLAELAEAIVDFPLRGASSIRRALELARGDLAEARETIGLWLPLHEREPRFEDSFFYDVEREPRGDLVLTSRVLLPNEVLGRVYYPELAGAAFVSATTWIQGGFEAAQAYLGLDRAAHPGAGEAREGSPVRTFRAPDVFDYGRVLVAIPKDAPSVSRDKDAFLAYVRRFVAHLAERTRGRMLVLFTNAADMKRVGEELVGFFRARRIPFWFQNQDGTVKEELAGLFRARIGSVLFGVDTFWYGADFPGEALEYLVIVKLPFGVPDRYHQAQCAAIGSGEQRRQIYMPRALSKFRQGFGRLMRRESDRGCVFVLDGRALEARHRAFLRELPIVPALEAEAGRGEPGLARLMRGDSEACMRAALEHMGLTGSVRERGLDAPFERDLPTPWDGPLAPREESA